MAVEGAEALGWQKIYVRPLPGADGPHSMLETLRAAGVSDEWLGVIAERNGYASAEALAGVRPGTELQIPRPDSLTRQRAEWNALRERVPEGLRKAQQALLVPPATGFGLTPRTGSPSPGASGVEFSRAAMADPPSSEHLRTGVETLLSELRRRWFTDVDAATVESTMASLIREGHTPDAIRAEYARQYSEISRLNPSSWRRRWAVSAKERAQDDLRIALKDEPATRAATMSLLTPPNELRDNVTQIIDELHGVAKPVGYQREPPRRDARELELVVRRLLERHTREQIREEYGRQVRDIRFLEGNMKRHITFTQNLLIKDMEKLLPDSPNRTIGLSLLR